MNNSKRRLSSVSALCIRGLSSALVIFSSSRLPATSLLDRFAHRAKPALSLDIQHSSLKTRFFAVDRRPILLPMSQYAPYIPGRKNKNGAGFSQKF